MDSPQLQWNEAIEKLGWPLIIGGGLLGLLVGLAIAAFICWLLYNDYAALPAEHRKLSPGLVWLLLIPCFSVIWNFFVFPGLAKSYQSYFAAKGVTDVGSCGEGLAWTLCVLPLLGFMPCIPCIGPCIGLGLSVAYLVVLVVFLVKANTLKQRVLCGGC